LKSFKLLSLQRLNGGERQIRRYIAMILHSDAKGCWLRRRRSGQAMQESCTRCGIRIEFQRLGMQGEPEPGTILPQAGFSCR
jgi:hypothetical protein